MENPTKKCLALLICCVIMMCALFTGCAYVDSDGKEMPSDSSIGEEVNEASLTFIADGRTIEVVTYTVGDISVAEPEVPSKKGYTGVWGDYTLTGGNQEVEAVYSYIDYTITYHVVLTGSSSIIQDYMGTWEGFWEANNEKLKNLNLPKKYNIDTPNIDIVALPTREFDVGEVSGSFSIWYTDIECTKAFGGTIRQGSTEDVHLYTKWSTSEAGPY